MKKFFELLTSSRFLLVLIGLSLLIIVIGLWFIQSANNRPDTTPAAVQTEIPLPPLPEITNEGPPDLERLQAALASMAEGVIPLDHGLSKEEIANALAEAEPGSEAWCDLLLLTDDKDWTESHTKGFAESCI